MALGVVTNAQILAQVQWNVGSIQPGLSGINSTNSLTKSLGFTLGEPGPGTIDEIYSSILDIAASGTQTLTVSNALTDVVNSASVTFARLKCVMIRLLSTTDDAVNGTACTSITVGNAASHPFELFFSAATMSANIPNGGGILFFCDNATGLPITASTHDQVLFTNNDTVNPAAVQVTFLGNSA